MSGLAVLPDAPGDANNPAASSEECDGHIWWGRWAEPTFLPNAGDNLATGAAYAAMRPGDLAYTQDPGMFGGVQGIAGLYELIDRGTDNAGDAVWRCISSAALTRFFESPTNADFYRAAAGVMPGADDFIIAVHARWESISPPAGGAAYRLVASQSANAGYEVLWVFGTFRFSVVDGANNVVDADMGGTWWDSNAGFAYMQNRDVLIHFRVYQDGGVTQVRGLINGALVASASAPAAGVNPSTNPADILGAASPWLGGVHGIAYYEGTLLDRELIAHADACLGQGKLVANGIPWDNLWNANDDEPGATWAPVLGADDLTAQGTPELFTRYRRPG